MIINQIDLLLLVLKSLLLPIKICRSCIPCHCVRSHSAFFALAYDQHIVSFGLEFALGSVYLCLEHDKRLHLFICCHIFPLAPVVAKRSGVRHILPCPWLLQRQTTVLRGSYIRSIVDAKLGGLALLNLQVSLHTKCWYALLLLHIKLICYCYCLNC